ncbi:alpha/beta fold hydrolase [[Mycoplasma] testudinis]|uniref:alpha/beta fold hydrolase n=1 Tax=[Mycoplasma] testudinis TaxID=33924 RepID=UPI000487F3C9|nr:alpha/beta hydrolase [[Mycoplasma] testudinis]
MTALTPKKTLSYEDEIISFNDGDSKSFFTDTSTYKEKLIVLYHQAKDPKAPTIVLCHGLAAPQGTFSILYEHLDDFNYYEFILPGHNDLPCDDKELNICSYAELVADWIINKGLKGIYLMGHSMGGAIVAIAETLLPKNVVKKLVLIAPYNLRCINIKSFVALKVLQNPKLINNKVVMKRRTKERAEILAKFVTRHQKAMNVLIRSLASIASIKKVTQAYGKITSPAYLITAENDIMVPHKPTTKHLSKKIKGLNTFVFPKATHIMFIDFPDLFMCHILDIINDQI